MKTALVLLLSGIISLYNQAPERAALARIKTAALVIHATSSVSCGDGSEGTCVRQDPDVITKVKSIVDRTEMWQHFQKEDATKADAIFEFTVKNAATTYGRIDFLVRDADSNRIRYSEYRDVVNLENDVTRIVSHFLTAVEEAKKPPAKKEPRRQR